MDGWMDGWIDGYDDETRMFLKSENRFLDNRILLEGINGC